MVNHPREFLFPCLETWFKKIDLSAAASVTASDTGVTFRRQFGVFPPKHVKFRKEDILELY